MKKINFEKIIETATKRAEMADRKYNRRNQKFFTSFQESFEPFRAAINDLKLAAVTADRINEIFDNSAAELKKRLIPDYRNNPYNPNLPPPPIV
ncbi:MAG: hypothetical protein WCI51_03760 [Lentisphaerota bacterium]